jgi:glycosyltransferase involved in cell wall biosynthesis
MGAQSPADQNLFITVAVPTCNRPDDISQLLDSLSRVRYPRWELLVIDQSDGDDTRLLADAWGILLPSIVYLRLEEKNASVARNLAIACGSGDVLAFIDDDCTVRPDWLVRVNETFLQEPDASLIFGAVTASEHDPAAALVPTQKVSHHRRLRGQLGTLRVGAMGASMSLRLRPATHIRFDPLLGPGAQFRSSQDVDYAYRVLAAGEMIVETPNIVVEHHGAREYAGGKARVKVRDYLYGAGAAEAKLLRCGQLIMIVAIIRRLIKSVSAIRPQNAIRHQPTRVGGLVMYLRGLRDSLRISIDRQAKVYRAS